MSQIFVDRKGCVWIGYGRPQQKLDFVDSCDIELCRDGFPVVKMHCIVDASDVSFSNRKTIICGTEIPHVLVLNVRADNSFVDCYTLYEHLFVSTEEAEE